MDWRYRLARDTRELIDLLLPPVCPGCRKQHQLTPVGICRACLRSLRFPDARCPRCAFPFAGEQPGHLCERCIRQPPAFLGTTALGLYQGPLRQLVSGLKFTRRPQLDRPLGRLLARRLQRQQVPRPTLVVPVPLHPGRLRQRGFNQAQLLAAGIASAWRVPLDTDLLLQTSLAHTQKGLSARQRLGNLRGAFAVNRQLQAEPVLLVDDVMTTGATLRVCAETLASAGAGEIRVAVLARAARLLEPVY